MRRRFCVQPHRPHVAKAAMALVPSGPGSKFQIVLRISIRLVEQ
jgi:hypothetical protein